MSFSPQLAYLLDRLSGFSTNTFKLEPQGSNTASANNIIRITLPANSLVNLRTFALHFNAAITAADAHGRLPNKIDSLIERVEVTFGGVQVAAGNNYYNVLRHAKDAVMGSHGDPVLSHPDVVRDVPYQGVALAAGLEAAAPYCVSYWEGFLGTVEPQVLDLSLLPECVVSIYLAPNSVCVDANNSDTTANFIAANGNAAPVYQLTNIHATIETIGMADGTYDAMVSQIMGKVGFLELPFKQYVSFRDSNANMRFSVASQSLDRLWLVHHQANHTTANGAVAVTGYETNAGVVATTFASPKYRGEKYIPAAFNFDKNAAANQYQLQLNGALVPQFKASFAQMSQITKQSVEKCENEHYLATMEANYAVFCVRLNAPGSEKLRLISGLDTRGIALNGIYNIDAFANKDVTIFAEITSTLKISSGLQIQVDQ
jgi:hypothetical protein